MRGESSELFFSSSKGGQQRDDGFRSADRFLAPEQQFNHKKQKPTDKRDIYI